MLQEQNYFREVMGKDRLSDKELEVLSGWTLEKAEKSWQSKEGRTLDGCLAHEIERGVLEDVAKKLLDGYNVDEVLIKVTKEVGVDITVEVMREKLNEALSSFRGGSCEKDVKKM
jgi:hypothetical protein